LVQTAGRVLANLHKTEVSGVNKEAIGEEASKELADLINQALAQDQKCPIKTSTR